MFPATLIARRHLSSINNDVTNQPGLLVFIVYLTAPMKRTAQRYFRPLSVCLPWYGTSSIVASPTATRLAPRSHFISSNRHSPASLIPFHLKIHDEHDHQIRYTSRDLTRGAIYIRIWVLPKKRGASRDTYREAARRQSMFDKSGIYGLIWATVYIGGWSCRVLFFGLVKIFLEYVIEMCVNWWELLRIIRNLIFV